MMYSHADIHDRLIDFIYGELDAEARTAFDAHVAVCDACRSEVRAFAQTRATARAVVRAPLEEPVPAAVRARVMKAAARETAARGAAAGDAAASDAAAPGAAGSPARGSAWWLAWLRARWAVPMFVTVAAMGALLLVRETIFSEARRPLGESPPAAHPSEIAPRAHDERDQVTPSTPFAATPDSSVTARSASRDLGRRVEAVPFADAGAGKRRRGSAVSRPEAAVVASPAKESPDLRRARAAADLEADVPGSRSVAPAQALQQTPPVPAVKSHLSAKSQARVAVGGSLEGSPSSSPPAVPEGGPSPLGRAEPRPVAPQADSTPVRQATSRSANGVVEAPPAAPTETAPPDLAAAGVDGAEKLMTAQRWNDAAIAYRSLLQRFPRHPSAPVWRRRLAAAEAAAAQDGQRFAAPPPAR